MEMGLQGFSKEQLTFLGIIFFSLVNIHSSISPFRKILLANIKIDSCNFVQNFLNKSPMIPLDIFSTYSSLSLPTF